MDKNFYYGIKLDHKNIYFASKIEIIRENKEPNKNFYYETELDNNNKIGCFVKIPKKFYMNKVKTIRENKEPIKAI